MSNVSRVWLGGGLSSLALAIVVGGFAWGDTGQVARGASAVEVQTFKASDGQVYAAVVVQPDLPVASSTGRDVVLVIDTSASQVGKHRESCVGLIRDFVATMGVGDRVCLVALDVAPAPLTEGLVAAGSAELQEGLKRFDTRAPLGTCDIDAGLQAAADLLAKRRGQHTAAIIYVGDGMNTAGVLRNDKIAALTGRLCAERITAYTVAVGDSINEPLMARIASETGGRAFEIGTGDSRAITLDLQAAVHTPVLYPEKIELAGGSLPILPNPAPPLRADQGSLFLTRGPLDASLAIALTGMVDGRSVDRQWVVTPRDSSLDYSYLPDMWRQWSRSPATAAPGSARDSLALFEADHSQMVTNLVVLGELAAQRGMIEEAGKFKRKALEHDPDNLEAKTLLRAVEKRQPELAQASAPILAATTQESETTQPPSEQRPEAAGRSRATISEAEQLERAAIEQLRAQTNVELSEARKLMSLDPQRAIDLLKLTLERIESAADAPESVRVTLRRQVESALRQAAKERERVELENAAAQQSKAQADEMRRLNTLLVQKQQQQSQIMEQFWRLMGEREFTEALMVARRARELNPGDLHAEGATIMAETSSNLDAQLELHEYRKHRTLLTLLQVDKSHIPFPDEPPIAYPDYQWWEEMSARRQKWARVDLARPSPAEEKIQQKLRDPVTLEFVETPLSDVVDFLQDFTGVNIHLNRAALEEEGVTSDTPVTIHVENISLKSALKLLLGDLNLTYIVKDDVLSITSQIEADSELIHKVYPVADLVIPVSSGIGGGLGGGLGGLGGGLGGGGGGFGGLGGGGGGFGGGGGGFGGFGFRNVPNAAPGGAGGGAAAAQGNSQDLSDELIELIQDVIAPDSWDVRGGPGSVRYYRPNPALVVRQTSEVHEQIGDVLDQSRGGTKADARPTRVTGLRNLNP